MTETNEAQQQPYDNLLKRLLEGQSTVLLPLLLAHCQPDLQVVEELNIEVLLPPRRTDRIYRSSVGGRSVILHIEFESGANKHMDKRLAVYHTILHEKHQLPVYSIIVYPFEVKMVCPPYRESDGGRDLLVFHYQTIPLWQMDARVWVEKRAIPLYGLLPTMDNLSKPLLLQAIKQLIEYYGPDEMRLREELLCFRVLLQRANLLPEQDIHDIIERISMLDPLLEQDPWIQGLQKASLEKGEARGEAKGEVKGELKATRSILARIVSLRFPGLSTLAETRVSQFEQLETLIWALEQLTLCADEGAARNVLQSLCTSQGN